MTRSPQPDEILAMARERVAARRLTEQATVAARRDRRWTVALFGILAGLLLTFLLWPGATLEWKLYAAVHGLVAQKHLVFLGDRPLPVCARNLGIYSSFVISLGWLWARGYRRAAALPARPLLAALALGVLAMAFDGVNSVLEDTGRAFLYPPHNGLRTITGTLFGIALTPMVLLVFNRSLRGDPEGQRPVLGWSDFGWLLLLNGLLVAAFHSGLAVLYWPLALLSVAAIIGELFVVFLLPAAVAFGYARRVTSLAQLARPAIIALVVTMAFASSLAVVRFAAEAG